MAFFDRFDTRIRKQVKSFLFFLPRLWSVALFLGCCLLLNQYPGVYYEGGCVSREEKAQKEMLKDLKETGCQRFCRDYAKNYDIWKRNCLTFQSKLCYYCIEECKKHW